MTPRLLSMKDAAKYVGISFWTLREMVMSGDIPHIKFKSPKSGPGRSLRRVLIDRNDLDALIEQTKTDVYERRVEPVGATQRV